MSLAWAAAGAAIGGLSAIFGNRAAAEAQRQQIQLQREAALLQYRAVEDSVNIMKSVNRDATTNAINEALRAGQEDVRQIDTAIKKAAGTSQASQEGLASGKTKGREMATLYLKGNKVLDQTKDQTQSVVGQLITQQDKLTNDLNNQLLKSYQDMSAVLANEGPIIPGNANRVLSGMFGGAMAGASLGSSFGGSAASTKLPSGTKGRLPGQSVYSGINIPSGINFNW
jgi:hypothetical protein